MMVLRQWLLFLLQMVLNVFLMIVYKQLQKLIFVWQRHNEFEPFESYEDYKVPASTDRNLSIAFKAGCCL